MENARNPALKIQLLCRKDVFCLRKEMFLFLFVTRNDGQSPQVNESKQYSLSRVFYQ